MKLSHTLNLMKKCIIFLLFEIIFLAITFPFAAFYGPFQRVKETLVKSVMETYSHQYIANIFLSDKEINKILGNKTIVSKTKNTDISKFQANNSIELQRINTNKNLYGYVLLVHDPKRIKVGFNNPSMTIDALASKYNSLAAINGGGFSFFDNGAACGYIISGGKVQFTDCDNFDEKLNAMAITKSGKLLVGSYSINDLKALDVSEALCFGPPIIVDGKKVIPEKNSYGISPRTLIGQREDGTIIMIVVGHRSTYNFGCTLNDAEDLLLQYGAVNAINLDGGGSTSMFYKDDFLELDEGSIVPRPIPSFVYVK